MNAKWMQGAGLLALVAALAGAAANLLAPPPTPTAAAVTAAVAAAAAPKALYWYDPMAPDQHFDKPGKSPYMDMELLPKYADAGANGAVPGVKIDPAAAQNLGMRIATAHLGRLSVPIDLPATVELNDRTVAVLQARSGGFVERVYALAPGDVVAADTPIVDLLAPEWAGAQAEFLALRSAGESSLLTAARERLRLLGMAPGLIDDVERTGRIHDIVTVRAPISGAVKTLDVRAGMSVAAGAPLARINGLESVWVEAALPLSLGAVVAPGMAVRVTLDAWPGENFPGAVIAVLPEANPESRTLRVRAELTNRGARLRPGMLARFRLLPGASPPRVLVPAEAVIRTGKRDLVLLALGDGHYRPVEVQLGPEGEEGGVASIAVLGGLAAGQQVVASGQFLIDSEAGLQGVLARSGDAASAP
jgi:Cu(I)/Ag(I) efflux system membrane fusion protein